MSTYYEYNFVSPQPLYARIKEEMRSYFDTGAVDDLLFPIWTEDCIKKFRKTLLKISDAALVLKDNTADLPDDFNAIREVWSCYNSTTSPILTPSAYYYQKDCRVTAIDERCSECFDGPNNPLLCNGQCSIPENYRVTHKVTNELFFSFKITHLLKPGNKNATSYCYGNSANLGAFESSDTFDIRDGKIIVSSRSWQDSLDKSIVYLLYYSNTYDDNGYQLIPDDYFIQDFIRKYIKWQLFQQLFNQTTDETFNQVQAKMQLAEKDSNLAYITASTETKKPTMYGIQHSIYRSYHQNDKYTIPMVYPNR